MALRKAIVISLFFSSPKSSRKAKSFFGDMMNEPSGVVIVGGKLRFVMTVNS
jgi:hypothetical protein